MAKTVEELLQENNDLLRKQQNRVDKDGDEFINKNYKAKFNTGLGELFEGVSKVAGGTYKATDAVKSFETVLEITGVKSIPILGAITDGAGNLARGVINVNSTLNETGKYGVTFGQNLGDANLAIKQAQLSLPEFSSLIQQSGKDMSGFAGGQNESAKRFLQTMKEMQSTDVGLNFKMLGVQTADFADALAATSQVTFAGTMNEAEAHDKMMKAAQGYIRETTLLADLTGKSRKEQEDARRKVMESAEVEAAIMRRQKVDPEFGNKMNAATLAMGRFGPGVQKLLAEEATLGGARGEEALKMKATLGPASEAVKAYAQALKTNDTELIEARKREAIAAVNARVKSDEFLKTTEVLGDGVYSYGELVKGAYGYEKNIQAIKKEMDQKGFKDATDMDAEAYALARQKAKEDGKLLVAYNAVTGKWQEEVDKGAAIGRGINAFDDMMGKVAGKTGEVFKGINDRVGTTVYERIPEFNQSLKNLSKNVNDWHPAGAGSRLAKDLGLNPAKSSFADGTKDVLGDWFGGNFGSGMPSMLHGVEAVIPKDKIGEFVKDMSTQGGQVAEQVKTGMGPMLEGLMGNIKTQVSSINTADIQGKIQSMTGNLTSVMGNVQGNMPDIGKVLNNAMGGLGGGGAATNEIKDQLVLLNKGMAQLISHAAETAQATEKQVRAIKSASNNKFD